MNAVIYARYSSHNQTEQSIEDAVLARTMELLQDQSVFDFIVDATWNYYVETNNQRKEIERIEKKI